MVIGNAGRKEWRMLGDGNGGVVVRYEGSINPIAGLEAI